MGRRRCVVTPGTVALLLVAGSAWAGPPPPPPPSSGDRPASSGDRPASAPPPPSSPADREPADPLVIDQRTPDTDLTGLWTYSRGGAAGPNYVRSVDEDPFFAINPVGYYQGVSVDSGNLPPFAPKEIGGSSAVLTWTGFERHEASSRVFFQLSAAVDPVISVEAKRVLVKLPRTSVKIRNNRRKLITKFFNTPIDEVKVNRSGKDVLVVLELRWEAEPSWRFEAGANGYQVLVVEFADTQTARPPAPPTPAPSSTKATKATKATKTGEGGSDQPFLPTH